MYTFLLYFLLFMIFSFLGWIMEIIVVGIPTRKFSNRGFLIGPYCPIYGIGALAAVFLIKIFKDNFILFFLVMSISATIIEYFTSYIMETLFKARWWDYSHKKFNLNGRVSLDNSIMFGILGIVSAYYINPYFINLLKNTPKTYIVTISILFLITFIIDLIISFKVISKIKLTTNIVKKDYTDEITEKVKEILLTNSKLTKRLIKAFPNLKTINNIIRKNK